MTTSAGEPLVNVATAAQESGLRPRLVWKIIKEQAVPVVRGPRARMSTARFRRADWEAGLDRSLAPVKIASGPGTSPPPTPSAPGFSDDDLSAWRRDPLRRRR
jgi:hypothetical protein